MTQDPWTAYTLNGPAERHCVSCARFGPTDNAGLCEGCYENVALRAECARLDEALIASIALENQWKARVDELESFLAWIFDRMNEHARGHFLEEDFHGDMLHMTNRDMVGRLLMNMSNRAVENYSKLCTARAELAEAVALLRDVYAEEGGEWLYAGGGETEWLAKRDAFLARHTKEQSDDD